MNPRADQLKSHARLGRHPQGCCLFPEHSLRIVWSLRRQLTLNVLKLSCFLNEKLDTCSNREVPPFHKYFFKWVVRLKYTDFSRFLHRIKQNSAICTSGNEILCCQLSILEQFKFFIYLEMERQRLGYQIDLVSVLASSLPDVMSLNSQVPLCLQCSRERLPPELHENYRRQK